MKRPLILFFLLLVVACNTKKSPDTTATPGTTASPVPTPTMTFKAPPAATPIHTIGQNDPKKIPMPINTIDDEDGVKKPPMPAPTPTTPTTKEPFPTKEGVSRRGQNDDGV